MSYFWHRNHNEKGIMKFNRIAEEYNLLKTGGSDFHSDEHQLADFGYTSRTII